MYSSLAIVENLCLIKYSFFRTTTRKKSKVVQYMKQNVIAEKIAWFRDNLLPDVTVYAPEQVEELINKSV